MQTVTSAVPDSDKSEDYFNQTLQSETVDGIAGVIFPLRSFTYPNGNVWLVQSFIVLDKRIGSSTWCYKFMAWN